MEIKTKKKESYTQRTKNRNDGQNQCKKNVYIVGKEKITEDIDILKNHFSSPFFNTRMFCKKKEKKKHVVLLKNIQIDSKITVIVPTARSRQDFQSKIGNLKELWISRIPTRIILRWIRKICLLCYYFDTIEQCIEVFSRKILRYFVELLF